MRNRQLAATNLVPAPGRSTYLRSAHFTSHHDYGIAFVILSAVDANELQLAGHIASTRNHNFIFQ